MSESEPYLYYVDFDDGVAEDALTPEERRLLAEINRRVVAQESTEAVVDFLFEQMRTISPCDRVSVAFVEEDGRRLVSHHTVASYLPLMLKKGYAEDLQRSSLQEVLRHRRLRVINDLEAYAQEHPRSRSTRMLVKEGVRSSLTCPLSVEGRVVGVLFRSARRPYAYDERQARVHAVTAERISQAIEKTYRIEQLAAANQAYTEMLGFVSHELKSPVASMVSTAQLLLDGYLGELSDKQLDAVNRMTAKGRYLMDIVKEYLDLAQIEGGELRRNEQPDVDFGKDVLETSLDIVRPQAEERRIEVKVDAPSETPGLTVDPSLLKIVMVNLLSNAVKYGRDDGVIRVHVERDPDKLFVSVWNAGPGFPAEQRHRLFRKFSRLQTKELSAAKGTGVGLYTVWRIIRLHGGSIDARSEEGEWAEFSFEIPQPLTSNNHVAE